MAVNVLKSWLKHSNIPFSYNTRADLKIKNNGPGYTFIYVYYKNELLKKQNILKIPATAFIPTDKQCKDRKEKAVQAFHFVTEHCGYGRPIAPFRVDLNQKRVSYKDDHFLCAIRPTEFSRSPNPENDKFVQYKDILKNTVNIQNRRFGRLYEIHGITTSDLWQYVGCWLVNFCAQFEVDGPKNFENQKILTNYIKQRFIYFNKILEKKSRSMIPVFYPVSSDFHYRVSRPDDGFDIETYLDIKKEYEKMAKTAPTEENLFPVDNLLDPATRLNSVLNTVDPKELKKSLKLVIKDKTMDQVTKKLARKYLKAIPSV